MVILGFDPGKDKCGIAVVEKPSKIIEHQVVISSKAIATVVSLCEKLGVETLVLGNQTTSKSWKTKLQSKIDPSIPIVLVDERNTSLEARDLYWKMYPAKGLTRLIPQGMRLPPRAIDDLVAILLIERYLHSLD